MISFENTIDIERDASRVYAYLTDLEHTPEWNRAIASSDKITPGPVGVGTQFRLQRAAPRPAVEVLEITGLRPGRQIDVQGGLGPFAARLSYELTDAPTGTRLTNSVELEPRVPIGPVGDLLGGRIRGAVADNLRTLKAVLEQD
jgi:hypothetical protein